MRAYKFFIFLYISFHSSLLKAQQQDTIHHHLTHLTIKEYKQVQTVQQLSDVHQTYIIGGRKNEVINIQDMAANLAEKTGRQLFAKIPGAFVYDMDGSGNQVNLAVRGLDPHRSWEFNVRQNGVIINSDMYGYPASHYSPPMEAIKNVELVHGTASLQYGAEFGGMINYVTKSADTSRVIGFESINSVGSYGLFSSFNALGGKKGNWTYYGYYQKRVSQGYRDNANSNADAQYLSLQYDFSKRLFLKAELSRSTYLYRIPGPLTDSMFYQNPRQSTRSRNYYSPEIFVPSLVLNYIITPKTTINVVGSGIFGTRNSVQFEGFADKKDVIDPTTLQYKNRTVDIDNFNSKTAEIRMLHRYQLGKLKQVVSVGLRYFNNNMHRRQQGKGTTGSDFDLSVTSAFGRDLYYKSQSIALAVENMIYLTDKFTITPGVRYEYGDTKMTGYISYIDEQDIPNIIKHRIPTLGINAQYKIDDKNRIYGGIAQSYRPVLFKDIIPGSSLEKANKNLKNAYGYNAEIGINGTLNDRFKYDITGFLIQYNNRLGNLVLQENNTNYIYKTNIGNSNTKGIEIYGEWIGFKNATKMLSFFNATAIMKGVYQNAILAVGNENKDISGNDVESVPRYTTRNGLTFAYKTMNATLQYSYVSKTFADPANTITPTANGAKGIVPAYGLWDFNAVYKLSHYTFRLSINNILNHQYFTKRPLFYPGPGVWSSDGRGIVLSVGAKF